MKPAALEKLGKLARRITVAAGGALGVAVPEIDTWWGQVIAAIVAVGLVALAEHFSASHDRKVAKRAIEQFLRQE